MARQLGETDDPHELVPGDPAAIKATAEALRLRGTSLHQAGNGLSRIDTADGWSGAAADAFRAKFHGEPTKWLEAGDCFHSAASALTAYAGTLTWAQQQAALAVSQWAAGQRATSRYEQAGRGLPLDDPGETDRSTARSTLQNARRQLSVAGDAAAGQVGTARDKAPRKPGFWSKVGDFFQEAGAGLANTGGHVLNGLASLGNAAIHHPGDVATAAAGAGLMIVGAAGDAGGGVLDLTVAGAVVGVPLNVVSTAAIVTGGGLVAAAGGDLMMNAANEDRVSPARTDHNGPQGENYEPAEGFRGSEYSRDEFVEFVNGHTGGGDPTMGRPSPQEVEEALSKASPERLPGQNAELFRHGRIKVILNYDMPWKSTSYIIGGR